MTTDYTVKLHQSELMNFKWNETRPLVKRILEETYVLQKELVVEQIAEMLDVPLKRINSPKDIDYSLRQYLSEKEEKEFIEKNNRLYDFWERTKPWLEEWLAFQEIRKTSPFKHFTIDLEELSWNNHSWDTPEDPDRAYIDVSAI